MTGIDLFRGVALLALTAGAVLAFVRYRQGRTTRVQAVRAALLTGGFLVLFAGQMMDRRGHPTVATALTVVAVLLFVSLIVFFRRRGA